MPGQKDYGRTSIRTSRGERWFCSEAAARAAGWRRAKRQVCAARRAVDLSIYGKMKDRLGFLIRIKEVALVGF
ncbi:hypothetical protein [Roseovarius lutimaris]|uniref:sunset domain-containing protein n=1 Tax=Roseovarius lutimaris TaxID=1005928 RepID=UPI003CCBCF8D